MYIRLRKEVKKQKRAVIPIKKTIVKLQELQIFIQQKKRRIRSQDIRK